MGSVFGERGRIVAAAAAAGVVLAAAGVGAALQNDDPAEGVATSQPDPTATAPQAAPAAPAARPPAQRTAARLPYALPSRPGKVRPCRPARGGGGPPATPRPKTPLVRDADLPPALPVGPRRVDLAPVTGKGMWLTTWADTAVDIPALIGQAKAAGLRQLWVRTGGSRQGWYGQPLLEALLPAAHAAGIGVVAWDFPFLRDPLGDAERARLAMGTYAGHRIDAFSPDIETKYEGTLTTQRRVQLYLSYVRKYAGTMPVVGTVMRPTESMLATYPYRAQVPYVDAFAPMVYWGCHEPGATTRDSVRRLAGMRPVHVIGQSYDMGGEGGPRGVPPGREIWRFLDVGDRSRALGASLYNLDGTGAEQWRALGAYPWRWWTKPR